MSNINEINNILSSIQMDRKDKANLAKKLNHINEDVELIYISSYADNYSYDEFVDIANKVDKGKAIVYTNCGYIDISLIDSIVFIENTYSKNDGDLYKDNYRIFPDGNVEYSYDEFKPTIGFQLVVHNNDEYTLRTIQETKISELWLLESHYLFYLNLNIDGHIVNISYNHSYIDDNNLCHIIFSNDKYSKIDIIVDQDNNILSLGEMIEKVDYSPIKVKVDTVLDEKTLEAIRNIIDKPRLMIISSNNSDNVVVQVTYNSFDYGHNYYYTYNGTKYDLQDNKIVRVD